MHKIISGDLASLVEMVFLLFPPPTGITDTSLSNSPPQSERFSVKDLSRVSPPNDINTRMCYH